MGSSHQWQLLFMARHSLWLESGPAPNAPDEGKHGQSPGSCIFRPELEGLLTEDLLHPTQTAKQADPQERIETVVASISDFFAFLRRA